MLKTIIPILIAILLFQSFSIGQSLQDNVETTKIKADLTGRGTGERVKLKIELRDKSEVRGYLAELKADDFVIADSKSGDRTTIAYRDVAKVRKQGLSIGVKLGIAGAMLGAVVIVLAANSKIKCSLICP
jgi:hypothetical protein